MRGSKSKLDLVVPLTTVLAVSLLYFGVAVGSAPASVQANNASIDICVAIDTSGSINQAELTIQTDGLEAALNNVLLPAVVDDGRSIGLVLVTFGGTAETDLPLTPVTPGANADAIVAALDAIAAAGTGGETRMADAINQCASELASSTASRMAIDISTDGKPDSESDTIAAADSAKQNGFEIWSLGVGSDADNDFLADEVVGCPTDNPDCGAKNFEVDSFDDFVPAIQEQIGTILAMDAPVPVGGQVTFFSEGSAFPDSSVERASPNLLWTLFLGVALAVGVSSLVTWAGFRAVAWRRVKIDP
ncbi:MAG: vWA domain-containing protein [Dehalococcoidia bacterium]